MRVCLFFSNVYFYKHSGYFDAATELKPLIHTWSLAVEEQYYIFFPLIIVGGLKFFRRLVPAILIVIGISSLLFAQYKVSVSPSAAFYLLPYRIWELIIGALVAYYFSGGNQALRNSWVEELGGFLGIALIVYSIFFFDQQTPFPSVYALLPTLGSALIILFASNRTLVGRLLSQSILVSIGLISYSLYLWHQPIFALARHLTINEPSKLLFAILSMVSVCLAYLSWRYVEKPFRNKNIITRRSILATACFGSVIFIGFGLLGSKDGFNSRFHNYFLNHPSEAHSSISCTALPVNKNQPISACLFGDKKANFTVAVWGDSHAESLLNQLDKQFKSHRVKGLRIDSKPCEAIPEIVGEGYIFSMKSKLAECQKSFKNALSYLNDHADGVILSVRWTMHLYPIPNDIESCLYDNKEGGVELGVCHDNLTQDRYGHFSIDAEGKKNAVKNLVSSFNELNKPIFLIYPVPEVGWDIPKMNLKRFILGKKSITSDISTSYALFKKRNAFINNTLDAISSPNIHRIRPEKIFCNSYLEDRCIAQFGASSFYIDTNHLSDSGADLVSHEIMQDLAIQDHD